MLITFVLKSFLYGSELLILMLFEENGELFIDLQNPDLNIICFQDLVGADIISSMQMGIKFQDIFPPVSIYQLDENAFTLTTVSNKKMQIDGGHHRLISHFKSNECLRIQLETNPNFLPPIHYLRVGFRDIREDKSRSWMLQFDRAGNYYR